MLRFLRKHKRELLVGIVVGLLLFPLQYIIPWLGESLISLLTVISSSISESYAHTLATQSPYLLDSVAHNAVLQVIIILALFMYMKLRSRIERIPAKLQKLRTRCEAIQDQLRGEPVRDTKEEIATVERDLENVLVEIARTESRLKRVNRQKLIVAVSLGFWICLVLYQWFYNLSAANTITGYTQCIERLKPVLSVEEEERIGAMWSSMKSTSDLNSVRQLLKTKCEASQVEYVDF